MSIFDVGSDVKQEKEKDAIGGFRVFDTDIYPVTIQVAYLDKFASGAHNITFVCKMEDGSTYNETITLTNKKEENFYKDKKTGDKRLLSGFNAVNVACQLLGGSSLGKMTLEEKQVKVWDKEASAQVPKPRKVLTDLVGIKANIGIQRILENKSIRITEEDKVKYIDDPTGATRKTNEIVKGFDSEGDKVKYIDDPTGATRERNEIVKWFDSELRTLPEVLAEKTACFYKEWEKANKGKTRNKVKKVKKVKGATNTIADAQATDDLFGEE